LSHLSTCLKFPIKNLKVSSSEERKASEPIAKSMEFTVTVVNGFRVRMFGEPHFVWLQVGAYSDLINEIIASRDKDILTAE